MPNDADYTINDLARLTGLNVRTIRYWIAQGLIPASGESGPGAHYGQGHLDRLRLIKRLQAEYLPNAEIRRRLAPLSDADVASLVGEEPDAEAPRPTTSALEYVRGLLGGAASQVIRPAASAAPTPPPPPAATAMPTTAYALAGKPVVAAVVEEPVAAEESPGYAATGIGFRAGRAPSPAPTAARIDAEAAAMPRMRDVEPPPQPTEPPIPERSQWERHSLGPNIELHVRRPLSRLEQRRVERLITIARQVLTEDQS